MMHERILISSVRKRYVTTLWMLCLAIAMAKLIVMMNAMAAAKRSRNVVTFYPSEAQQSGIGFCYSLDGKAK